MRRSVVARAAVAALCVLGMATASASAADDCADEARALGDRLERIGLRAQGDVDARATARERLDAEVRSATEANPRCADAFRRLAAGKRAPGAPGEEPEGFAGPIGWLWNTVYYRVYQGNAVMMAIFGWTLLLAPLLMVFALGAVLRGTKGALRRPEAPAPARARNA